MARWIAHAVIEDEYGTRAETPVTPPCEEPEDTVAMLKQSEWAPRVVEIVIRKDAPPHMARARSIDRHENAGATSAPAESVAYEQVL